MSDYVAVICTDRPNSMELRLATRPAHLDWIRKAPFPVAAAGPRLAPDGKAMTGSILIVGADDAEAVRKWAAGDPYALAGLFESVTVERWRHLIGPGLPRGAAEAAQD